MNWTDKARALRHAVAVEPLARGHFLLYLSPFYSAMGHPRGGYLLCVEGR